MKVIDISRELFSTPVYPGDPVPRRELVRRMELGDSYNLSGFYTGCHSATHVDAPRHFIDDGKTVDEMELSRFVGRCTVVAAQGIVTGADIGGNRCMEHRRASCRRGAACGITQCRNTHSRGIRFITGRRRNLYIACIPSFSKRGRSFSGSGCFIG